VTEATALEKVILDDVEERTGMRFRRVGGIDTRDKAVAGLVLPVLVDWVGRLSEANYRGAVYRCFHTEHARPYLETILSWWMQETDRQNIGFLTQTLALIVDSESAARVWGLYREMRPQPCHYILMSRLAEFTAIGREIRDMLVRNLTSKDLDVPDLLPISRVADPRIREWFLGQQESRDPGIRTIAKKVAARGSALPSWVSRSSAPPDRLTELFSTECDLDKVRPLLVQLAARFRIRLPASVRKASFLWFLETDTWVYVGVETTTNEGAVLWSRMEDYGTVEVVITQ
jgi:hypothetical protein